jgi:hypothetical protein
VFAVTNLVLDHSEAYRYAVSPPPGRMATTRSVRIIDTGGGATMAPLICEDLARLDEVADVLRRIGRSFVMALLLDGPLAQRWACRSSSVLADDPGCAVRTLTSLGMTERSRPPGCAPARAVAMWSDPTAGKPVSNWHRERARS